MQALVRQLRLQYAMRKDVIWLGGIGFFYLNADHLILQRTHAKLQMLGLCHDRKMDTNFSRIWIRFMFDKVSL